MTLDASFVLVVCGAAWIHPALGLLVGGTYLGLIQLLHWRTSRPEPGADAPTPGAEQ